MNKKLNNLKRGDRFITRAGLFGNHVQDYFAVEVSTIGDGIMIHAVSANISNNLVARDSELEVPSWGALHDIWMDATGRWYQTWTGKKDGVDLLEAVEPAKHCLLCNGVRSIGWIDDQVVCINCRARIKEERICEHHPYGEHIPVFCDRCGAAHSTKNIGSVGSRHVHPIYDDSCVCKDGWFFHDCKGKLFVKGQIVDGKFAPWADKFEEGRT